MVYYCLQTCELQLSTLKPNSVPFVHRNPRFSTTFWSILKFAYEMAESNMLVTGGHQEVAIVIERTGNFRELCLFYKFPDDSEQTFLAFSLFVMVFLGFLHSQ